MAVVARVDRRGDGGELMVECPDQSPDTLRDMRTATNSIAPLGTCHACNGTGIDSAFGGDCVECLRDAENAHLLEARFAAARGRDDRMHTPGERLDGRTFGGSTGMGASGKQLDFIAKLVEERANNTDDVTVAARKLLAEGEMTKKEASGAINLLLKVEVVGDDGIAWCANRASDKQIAFIESLIAHVDRSNEQANAECETFEMLIETRQMNKGAASASIDILKKAPKAPVKVEAGPVDGLDLTPLEAFTSRGVIRMGVPNSDTRLKVSIKFARNGTIYVDDAAVYGYGQKYGQQRPGQGYSGDIADELAAILADPQAAVVRYAELTDRCGVCNTALEDAASIARGMGPICAKKFA
jgi:hypothetical protein